MTAPIRQTPRRLLDIPLAQRVARLNKSFAHATPQEVLEVVLDQDQCGRIALVSSFGAEAVVLLHMVAQIDRAAPVLFLNTEMLFPETLRYQREVAEYLQLSKVQVITPDRGQMLLRDTDGLLHRTDTASCCALRKTAPLQAALADYDGWITGRKRHQSASRAQLEIFESEAGRRMKINPLAHWTLEETASYMARHALPRHPLVKRGYPSIGCAVCTQPVMPGQAPRSGRWAGTDKSECGIHLVEGRLVRRPRTTQTKEEAL